MKAEETHKMSNEELTVELDRLHKQLFALRSQSVTEKLDDPSQITNARRDIARIKTEQSSRRIKQQAEA
jgi:large subunit ribosomal protein L29